MVGDTHGHLSKLLQAAEQLKRGDFNLNLPPLPDNELGQLGRALLEFAQAQQTQLRQMEQLDHITQRINSGLLLDDILDNIYEDFRELIPYNRIGFALIEDDGETVRSRWAKSDRRKILLRRGYSAVLAGSSLETILMTGEPRILNDLRDYLQNKPDSLSTQMMVEEGYQSSLTCPLIANGIPVGFIFFSSIEPYTYLEEHIDLFQRIAGRLAVIVEKGRLVSRLNTQKVAIERQNRELERLNDLKNAFIGMAAHDLRSPLGAIQMAMDFLSDETLGISDADRANILRDVSEHVDHTLELLNSLLDIAQIESGKLELVSDVIDVQLFLDDVVTQHARTAFSKGTSVVLEGTPEGTIMADPTRLRQVIDNLISNAVKYSPGGSTIRVWAECVEDVWRFNIQDEGPGIGPEDRLRLFQDFARLSALPTGGERSTGLGLAISRRIVEAHHGQIDVDPAPGHGSIFWFTLPT